MYNAAVSTLGQRIKLARQHLADISGIKVTQSALARLCGWEDGQTKISNYENDEREPGREIIKKIAEVTQVRPEWLIFESGSMLFSEDETREHMLDEMYYESKHQMSTWFSFVPRTNLTAGLGRQVTIESEQIVDNMAFRNAWLAKRNLDSTKLCLITCIGDSMTPTISDGDLALVDLRKDQRFTDGIYAMYLDGGISIKRIKMRMDRSIEIASDNPSYSSESYSIEAARELITVIGRVVWIGRDIA
jgi:phage repressor protein C with HTH and peptisase S24 domain